MRHFVRQHPREFGFRVEEIDQPAVDIDIAARKGKGIDFRAVDNEELVLQIGPVSDLGDAVTDLRYVFVHFLIFVKDRALHDLFMLFEADFLFPVTGQEHKIRRPGRLVDRAGVEQHQRGDA